MHRSVLHSKSFQRYFLTYAAIFAAMIFISILLLARTTNNERARAAEQQRALQTEKISTQLDDMWKSAGSVGELLNNSSWVEKYKSDTDVFDADFDLVSRQEISQTLQNVCLSSTVVQDIGVIYPRKNTVITPQGWFDLKAYQTFLQRRHLVETEDFLDDVLGMTGGFSKLYAEDFAETTPDTLVYVSQLDILDSPRAIAVIYLDKSVIARQLQQISGAQVCAVRIANAAGDTRMQLTLAEPDPDDVVTMQVASRNMLLNYVISFENQRMPFMQGAGGYLLISGVAVLSMLLAYALAKMQYSPVNRLMRMLTAKTGVNSQSGDMDTIAFCIDNLFADNESLKKMVTSYQQTLNRQQVVQLLRGYFNEDVARLMQGSDNPFTENFVYAVLVLQRIKDNRESPDEQAQESARYIVILQHIVEKLCQEQNHCELVEQVDGNTAVIIEFPAMPDRDALMAIAETVHAALAEQDIESRAFVGRPCRGLAGISTSYQAAVETMQTDTGHTPSCMRSRRWNILPHRVGKPPDDCRAGRQHHSGALHPAPFVRGKPPFAPQCPLGGAHLPAADRGSAPHGGCHGPCARAAGGIPRTAPRPASGNGVRHGGKDRRDHLRRGRPPQGIRRRQCQPFFGRVRKHAHFRPRAVAETAG